MTEYGLYAWSIILPLLAFISIHKWPGVKYYKSADPKTKQIGQIACALLLISTIVTLWLAVVWTQSAIKSATDNLTAQMTF